MILKITCPLVATLCLAVGLAAYNDGQYGLVAVNAAMFGVNAVLTYINWR